MPRGMRQAWQIATAIMLAICLLMVWQSLQLPLTDRLGPGPGFFPLWLSLVGAVLAATLLLWASLGSISSDESPAILPDAHGARRILAVLVAVALVAGLMPVLGFRLSMLLFVAALVVALGERRWWAVALFALAGSVGVYQVFNNWLDVILPTGPWGI